MVNAAKPELLSFTCCLLNHPSEFLSFVMLGDFRFNFVCVDNAIAVLQQCLVVLSPRLMNSKCLAWMWTQARHNQFSGSCLATGASSASLWTFDIFPSILRRGPGQKATESGWSAGEARSHECCPAHTKPGVPVYCEKDSCP
jgi:hypothetical protein